MRWPLIAFLGPWLALQAVAAAQTFPYKAFVTTDDVYVRSGPGDNYYPTDKLKQGQEVEVYRHDPGGWYAIRPPKGSFSWVSGRALQFDRDNLAKVVEDRVAARVGSRCSDVRDVIQVRLHRGEVVEVFDARRTGASDTASTNTWYKISPPSGEFRWVSGRFIDPQFPADGLQRHLPSAGPAARSGHADEPQNLVIARLPSEPSDPGLPIPRRLSAEQYQQELNDLDVELSTMVVEEPSAWEFSELHQRAQSLFNQAETAVERGRARMILVKIVRFDDIKQRYDKLATLQHDMARTGSQTARLSRSPSLSTDSDSRFDASGQLTRVEQPKPGAPQYAILDRDGSVRCYVSPAPGVNLRSYVGRQVGITGIRGYMPEQRAVHIMARQISILDAGAGSAVLR